MYILPLYRLKSTNDNTTTTPPVRHILSASTGHKIRAYDLGS